MGYQDVLNQVATAAQSCGRNAQGIRLLAVSKTKSPEDITRVYEAGQRQFAENYVDELVAKAAVLKDLADLHWVFIGQLQSNKIQKLVQVASEIQTVASEKHARYIQRYAAEFGKAAFPVWIHVNAEAEEQKFGTDYETASSLSDFIAASCPNLVLQGIMAVPPAHFSDQNYPTDLPKLYKELRQFAAAIGRGQLSLGMSGDLKIAIKSGTDCIRIGTAIFGTRS